MINKLKFIKTNLKYILFYTFLCVYCVFGIYTIYIFIKEYSLLQSQPKSIATLYITSDKSIFFKSIALSILLNFGLALHLVKNYTKNKLLKILSIFFCISAFLIFFKKLDFFGIVLPLNAITVFCSIILFIFSSNIAIQNFSILAFFLMIFFHVKTNTTMLSTAKKILTICYFIINFVIFPFLFPHYWLGSHSF